MHTPRLAPNPFHGFPVQPCSPHAPGTAHRPRFFLPCRSSVGWVRPSTLLCPEPSALCVCHCRLVKHAETGANCPFPLRLPQQVSLTFWWALAVSAGCCPSPAAQTAGRRSVRSCGPPTDTPQISAREDRTPPRSDSACSARSRGPAPGVRRGRAPPGRGGPGAGPETQGLE